MYGGSGLGGDIAEVIIHSIGGEYTGNTFAKVCNALGVVQPMGRVGSALGNATAESFNSTIESKSLGQNLSLTGGLQPRVTFAAPNLSVDGPTGG